MFAIYTILANLIAVCIESIRIKSAFGKVANINKFVTYTIGYITFGLTLAFTYADYYYYTPNVWQILLFALFFISVRGVIYDPILNLLTGKKIDYVSTSTNSIIDQLERLGLKWSFYTERIFYLVISVLS
jgi:hypothetical protein